MEKNAKTCSQNTIIGVQIGITSGCAIYRNGDILFAASEERYSGIKNDTSFPERAIYDAIKYCGIETHEIEKVVLVSKKMTPDHFLVSRESTYSISDYLIEQNSFYYPKFYQEEDLDYLDVFESKIDKRYRDLYQLLKSNPGVPKAEIWNEWRVNRICAILGVGRSQVTIVNHEKAHACYGYYGSPFRGDDVLIATMDGFGDSANASIGVVEEGKQIALVRQYDEFNIGRIYRYITLLLGMKPNEHEYKVMGLAPYASPYNYQKAFEVFQGAYKFLDSGEILIDPELKDHFFYFKKKLEACRFDAIAGGLQLFTEKMIIGLIEFWMKKTGKRRLVLSGGVSLNIKANMEIGKLPSVCDLFVCGSGGDESLCIGGIYCYLDENFRGQEINPVGSLYLGEDIPLNDMRLAVESIQGSADCVVIKGTPENVAKEIASGKILGRAAGRMEFGARALGNRSIIADPRSPLVIKKINSKIKNRDFWMPFTPSILSNFADDYLVNPKKFKFPFMTVACETSIAGQTALAGALHPSDSTARPQIVEKSINSAYFETINCFSLLTGVGGVLNTSLNLHGSPIARTAADAANVFVNSDLDGLVINDVLILKNNHIS